jgi:hypothetical protein
MQQGCPQPHEEVPSALETLLLESASYISVTSHLSNVADDKGKETVSKCHCILPVRLIQAALSPGGQHYNVIRRNAVSIRALGRIYS